jgi:hypothetical protein
MEDCKHVLSINLKRTISGEQQNKCIFCNDWIFTKEHHKLVGDDE